MIGIVSVLLGGVAFLWRTLQRALIRDQLVETHLRVLQADIAALSTCQAETVERDQTREQLFQAVTTRLEALEQRLRLITRRQDEQLNTNESGETSYGAAIRLAHQGANVEQLVNTFGLARGEAELIAALHRTQTESSGK